MLFGTVHAGNFQPDTLGNDPDLTTFDLEEETTIEDCGIGQVSGGTSQVPTRCSASLIHGLGDVVFDLPGWKLMQRSQLLGQAARVFSSRQNPRGCESVPLPEVCGRLRLNRTARVRPFCGQAVPLSGLNHALR